MMRCDVAIIGAGPAGSVAAATLARRGARVLLIDGSHPREKPCGGGLTGRALALVDGLLPTGTVPGVRVRAARFLDSTRGRSAVVPLAASRATLVVSSRAAFDSALFDAAVGAGVVALRDHVAGIAAGPPHVLTTRGGRQVHAPFVVGADGANSLVRRRFASPFRRDQLSTATGVYARGIVSDEIVLEMVGDPAGYIWSFPRPDHLAIGICAQAHETTVARVRGLLTTWLAATDLARGARLEQYAWPIPSLQAADFAALPLGGRGWLTIGDAAGLVDPITREGIFFALQSALFAADALADAGDPSGRYAARVRDEIGSELHAAATLKAGFFRPRFARLLIDALESSGPIREVMADLVAGAQPYRTLKRRLLRTLEVGVAWKWLREVQRAAS